MPTAFTVAGSPITTAGTLAVTGAGLVSQYIRGDGSLADFPATTGGGSSVSYYLNGSVSQGTIGGVAYKELNRTPVFGAGTDISISADGYIASFITDALDPNKLLIPAGNWNFETYFSASSSGGSPSFYVELYKYNGTTFTLIASSSSAPELIAFGTNLNPYFSTLAVPETVLALTDRLAIRYFVTHSGRTITLHTENNHLCEIITTFTTGLTALNGLTNQVQYFAVGTSGTDFAISSVTDTHTFNLPTASASNRGALSSADWTTFNGKENAITAGTTLQYFRGDKTFQTLNTAAVPELTNLYYTEARVNANTNVAANTAARHNAVTIGTASGLSLSTQVLSLGLASAGVTGALSGTDWSTFNGKTSNLGTVTSVGLSSATSGVTIGSTPITSSGTITLAIATASGSQNGLLSSTDWTTFNGKQNALTNPVTGTGTTNYLPKFTGASTIGNSLVFDNGNGIGIGTTSLNNLITFTQTIAGSPANLSELEPYATVKIKGRPDRNNIVFIGALDALTGMLIQSGTTSAAANLSINPFGGNVLIGTTTDAGFKLDVNGTGRFNGTMSLENDGTYGSTYKTLGFTGNSNGSHRIFAGTADDMYFAAATARGFQFWTNGAATTRMTITSGGNVGIGTASPSSRLVVSDTSSNKLTISGGSIQNGMTWEATGGANSFYLFNGTISAAGWGVYNITTAAFPLFITNGSNVLIGTTVDNGANFQVAGNGRFTRANDSGSILRLENIGGFGFDFSRSQTTGALSIQGSQVGFTNIILAPTSGNVGIGTTSPDTYSYGGTRKFLTLCGTATNEEPFLQLIANGVGNSIIDFGNSTIRRATIIGFDGSSLAFYTNGTNSGTTVSERMRITSGGNVLIGTTTDNSNKLRVEGQIFINANTQLDSKTTTGVGSSAVAIASFSGSEGSTYFITAVNGANYYRAIVNQVQTSVTIVNSISVGTVGSVSISTSSNILTMAISSGTWTIKCTQIRTV